jgi:antitoxin ParD1/3/4
MSTTLNLSLTDELKKYLQRNSGEGTVYSTPSDYVRDLIRHDMEKKEISHIREKILSGLQDAVNGEMTEFTGDVRDIM